MQKDRPETASGPPVVQIAKFFVRHNGHANLPTSISAPLRRMAPEHWSRHLNAILPVLVKAGIKVQHLDPDDMARWASLVHMVACLSGTTGNMAHDTARPTGRVLNAAGYSEARLEKLLSARGTAAMSDEIARLARFLAAKRAVPLDLRPLAELIRWVDIDAKRTEAARLTIASYYYDAPHQETVQPEATL